MLKAAFSTIGVLISCFSFSSEEGAYQSQSSLENELDLTEPSITALYMISSVEGDRRDFIGQGKTRAYIEGEDGSFHISGSRNSTIVGMDRITNSISISFAAIGEGISFFLNDYWTLTFVGEGGQPLKPGIYKNVGRYLFSGSAPGLNFCGWSRNCNEISGEFEILELKYNDKNQIEAFAANFIQNCEKEDPPLFGSVRYRSAVPLEARFKKISEEAPVNEIKNTYVYLTKYNANNEIISFPIFISEEKSKIDFFNSLPYGGDGIRVEVDDKTYGKWSMCFAAPINKQLTERGFEDSARYPFHSALVSGMEVMTPDGYFVHPKSGFKVVRLVRDKEGMIKELALNFKARNEKGDVLKGAIRYISETSESEDWDEDSEYCDCLMKK